MTVPATQGPGPWYPMESYNNMDRRNPRMRPPPTDLDLTPRQYRRFVNNGALEVQLFNGLRNQIARGVRFPYKGAGWLYNVGATIPGLQRDQAGYFAPSNGMDQLSLMALWQQGPGSQPKAPGLTGAISAPVDSPMTG